MPPKRRVDDAAATPSKRARRPAASGFASQPILVESQLSQPRQSPRRAISEASQALNFESRLRKARPEDTVVAPTEGSEQATAASSAADEVATYEEFDASLMDDFEGLDFSLLPRYVRPASSQSSRKSWIYRYGWRVALLRDPSKLFFVCRYCYDHKMTPMSGIYETTRSTTAAARHLEEQKRGHGQSPPSKTAASTKVSWLERMLKQNSGKVSQTAANELLGFNTQRFRMEAVSWLVENNHPLSEFESPAFRRLIAAANPQAEAALWASHVSVTRFVVRLYDYLKPRVVQQLLRALSKIHISFDGWTTKGGKRGFLGVVAHYVDSKAELRDVPIALPQLSGAHSGEMMAEVVIETLQDFGINAQSIGYFVLDNASNNDCTVEVLAHKYGFNAAHRRLRCGPHTLNLVGQTLLWGKDGDAFNNDARELHDEHDFMEEWRRVGPLGVLLSVISYIKTPQQHKLFEDFQRLAHKELPADALAEERKVLEPVKPVVTRWNSYYSCFERAVKLQSAINAYSLHHIRRVRDEDTWAESRGNKQPVAQSWMRSDGLGAADWAVITEYMDVLKPLKTATERLEGRGKSGGFGSIAEVIPVFEYLLSYYEQRVNSYAAVDYNAHPEAPEDHLATNLRAAWAKADDYYSKLDDSPAYYAATILHPYYKHYLDKVWSDKPDWIATNNSSFRALWAQYDTLPRAVRPLRVISNDMDEAIDALINPSSSDEASAAEDEYTRWKRSEPAAERGTEYANNPIKYWVAVRDRYPSLSKLALDVLSIPASSCDCERMFSELGDLLEPRRRCIKPQLLAAIQCVRGWQRAGFSVDGEAPIGVITDDEMELLYGLADWEDDE
ncbi:Dimer-Tnp-hAT domain-containing protein [Pyrenophora tritici-repentis]|uniref:Dimer-Tnp-hAT domain containing protein n=2 Tax=Pyrenophora tritici-repentis TaxID=45151 RepID=A0A316ZNC6_9PLEO|nr:Dimer-Tnp-hAT domain-containing protein [Pyrenophora tritici-repentis]KAF7575722.1 Dimer-Tnp-hAT domain containing protein [Pyrenophora tritici-repentis]KAI1676927.1 Dimer-Tnp-hAT dimerization containing protein [Pyrenophora tritici-repentis]